jgi:mRNA interferase RelE/StbE
MYRVELVKKAKKDLEKIPKRHQRRIDATLVFIGEEPYRGKKLRGDYEGYYSVRIGPYRIIYTVKRRRLLVLVIRVGHRQGVYK